MIQLDKNSKEPIYFQMYKQLKEEIISGNLEPNTKLPSIRQLASDLKISRTTIESTYHQLYIEGYITSKPKVGYFVNYIDKENIDYNFVFQGLNEKNLKDANQTSVKYDFRNQCIDQSSFNFSLWKKYLNKALLNHPDKFLSYGSPRGEYELRKEIAKYVKQSRGVICTPDQIIIGAGVQTLINILCTFLKTTYKTIGFEDPGFNQARHIFKDHNFTIVPITLEKDGIDINTLKKSNSQIVYVSPSNQFPTGSVMSINKRISLLKWARENKALIIEDDYDSELRYFGRPIPSLQGLDEGANVIYLGSFSKILLPAIRISYMIVPQVFLKDFLIKLKKYNQTSSKIEQIALALFMKDGKFLKHIRKLRKIYAKKNHILIQTIEKIMKNKVNIIGKETGLHILLELKTFNTPEKISSLAEKVGVKVVPISNYSIMERKNKYPLVLLSYSGIPLEDIEPAIQLLNKVWFE